MFFLSVPAECSTEKSASIASQGLPVSIRACEVFALDGTTRAIHTMSNILFISQLLTFSLLRTFYTLLLKLNFVYHIYDTYCFFSAFLVRGTF